MAEVIDASDSGIIKATNFKWNVGELLFEFYSEQELMSMVRNEKTENLVDIKSVGSNRHDILKNVYAYKYEITFN